MRQAGAGGAVAVGVLLIMAGVAMGVAADDDAAGATVTHPCADDARGHARRLLALHAEVEPGAAVTVDVDRSVTPVTPLRNPADPSQRLDVLEIWGYVYKAQYRMRFLYAQIPGACPLVGQEILEYGKF